MGFYFAQAFLGKGYQVSAICGPRPSDNIPSVIDALREAGVEVIEETGFESFFDLQLVKRLRLRLQEMRPAAIVCMFNSDTKLAAWLALWLRIPFFVSAQNHNTFFGSPLVLWLKRHIYSLTLKICVTRVVCTSDAVRRKLVLDHGLPARKMCILPNGIDTAKYTAGKLTRDGFRQSLGLPPDAFLFINVGRIGEQKGQEVLLRAFAQAVASGLSAHLLLIGDTSADLPETIRYGEALRAFVRDHELKDRVHFLGWRDDIADVLCASDVYVHSALWEGWALAPLEAMACSLPAIMTDCSGCPEGFVNGTSGYIVPTGAAEPLASAMSSAFRLTAPERLSMGARGRQIVQENYDIQAIGRKFVEIVANPTPA